MTPDTLPPEGGTAERLPLAHQWLVKLVLFAAWPLMAAMLAVFLVTAWLLIPLAVVMRKREGGYTMRFPWSDR